MRWLLEDIASKRAKNATSVIGVQITDGEEREIERRFAP
jgi:hypothetical protein